MPRVLEDISNHLYYSSNRIDYFGNLPCCPVLRAKWSVITTDRKEMESSREVSSRSRI